MVVEHAAGPIYFRQPTTVIEFMNCGTSLDLTEYREAANLLLAVGSGMNQVPKP